jgi:hypothetical protein
MDNLVEIAVLVAAVGYVIFNQVKGQSLHGRQLVLLPAVLIVLGVTGLAGMSGVSAAAVACLAASALIAAAIGLGQGAMTRLEVRDGTLWGRLPRRGLWLWAALIASRVAIVVVAHVIGADAAASLDSIVLALGINRLAQAGVIAARSARTEAPLAR